MQLPSLLKWHNDNPSLVKWRILQIIIPQTGFHCLLGNRDFVELGEGVGVRISWNLFGSPLPLHSLALFLNISLLPSPPFCRIECKFPTPRWESFSLCKANWEGAAWELCDSPGRCKALVGLWGLWLLGEAGSEEHHLPCCTEGKINLFLHVLSLSCFYYRLHCIWSC